VFDEAQAVVFELELQNPATIEQLMRCKDLSGSSRLGDLLPPQIMDRIRNCPYFENFWIFLN
jgi:hypothetical protein